MPSPQARPFRARLSIGAAATSHRGSPSVAYSAVDRLHRRDSRAWRHLVSAKRARRRRRTTR